MKIKTLKKIIENKKKHFEFSIITDLSTGETEIFEKNFIQIDNIILCSTELKKLHKSVNDEKRTISQVNEQ